MQTLFDSSGLEEESLCPQQLRSRRWRMRRRREKRSKGGERRFKSGSGYVGDSRGVGRIDSKKSTHSGSHSARQKRGTLVNRAGEDDLFWERYLRKCGPTREMACTNFKARCFCFAKIPY